jgi:demethylmenaquinone methyltransferase/2-methoxy-6-polyprenyl-1,4-benzoquinol methylase
MKSAESFFDKFSKQYEAQSRYKYLFYRWTVDNVIKQINREKPVILDLGTGNGEIAIRAALKFPYSSVIGLDVSSGMIKEAEKKVRKMGLKNVRFIASPMENLNSAVEEAFHIQSVDFVVSNLAFHHVKNKSLVIRNIHRILSYRGRLIIGDWFKPTRAYEKKIEKSRLKNPMLSKKFDESWQDFISDPSGREYSEEHPKEYPVSQLKLKNIVKKAGFRKQRTIKMPMAIFAVIVGEK